MPPAEFFSRFGVFVSREFLDAALCSLILESAPASTWEEALVYKEAQSQITTDGNTRSTWQSTISKSYRAAIVERLSSLRPALQHHFGLELASFEEPHLLRYQPGDFFHGHTDCTSDRGGDPFFAERQVSIVVFLNSQTDVPAEGSYCGGSLLLAGLVDDPRARFTGLPLAGEAGLLIAFRSDTFHEVQPVTSGERYTLVTFFHQRGAVSSCS